MVQATDRLWHRNSSSSSKSTKQVSGVYMILSPTRRDNLRPLAPSLATLLVDEAEGVLLRIH